MFRFAQRVPVRDLLIVREVSEYSSLERKPLRSPSSLGFRFASFSDAAAEKKTERLDSRQAIMGVSTFRSISGSKSVIALADNDLFSL